VHAQTPIIKIDLNISGRTELEVNEPDTSEGINVNTLSVSTPGNVKVSNGMCFCSIKYCKCVLTNAQNVQLTKPG
jgi:hypothetical protein